MCSIGPTTDDSSSDPVQPRFRGSLAKCVFSAVAKTGIVLGCLIAVGALSSCGSSPAFDRQGYSQNISLTQKARGTNSKNPAIFGIGGWEGGNHMDRVVGPLALREKFSDCKVVAYGRWTDIMEPIKRQHVDGHPIIIIAYSAGCSDALRISNILGKARIPVGLIFLDATYLYSGMFKPSMEGIEDVATIPGNVYMIENYVTPSPFGGRDLAAQNFQDPVRTKFRNNYIWTSHLNLLDKKYIVRYAASVRSIMNEYSGRY